MKVGRTIAIGAAATVAALIVLLSSDDEKPTVGGCGCGPKLDPVEPDDERNSPAVGFLRQEPDVIEEALSIAEPAALDVREWEYDKPTMGGFYQTKRDSIILGTGRHSISHMALIRVCDFLRSQGHDVPRGLADEFDLRLDYAKLIVAGRYNTTLFATWGYGAKAFVGTHGRSIPLNAHHYDVQTAMHAGRPLRRMIPLCTPSDAGTGKALRTTGLCRPYLWLPLISLDALMDGHVSVEGCTWPDGSPTIDPPAWFMRYLP